MLSVVILYNCGSALRLLWLIINSSLKNCHAGITLKSKFSHSWGYKKFSMELEEDEVPDPEGKASHTCNFKSHIAK